MLSYPRASARSATRRHIVRSGGRGRLAPRRGRAGGMAPSSHAAAQKSTTRTFIQGTAFAGASPLTVTLTSPVAQGDLLVGWFAQYHAPALVQVSDDVNGTWTRTPGSLTFLDDTGDIALYYRE